MERYNLAEGPIWSTRDQALYWVDIRRPAVHRYRESSGVLESWLMPALIGSLAVCEGGGLLVALQSGLSLFDPDTRSIETVATPEPDLPDNRFNDGKCDRHGRFWVGTMHNTQRVSTGSLYRFDASHTCTKMVEDIVIPNSLAWSPDSRTMYFADTIDRLISCYDFDLENGEIYSRRAFAEITDGSGGPDGSTVDEDGCLWNAVYGRGVLHRYTPRGELDQVIELPMTYPTSCAFGGSRLDSLYVTSAAQNLSESERKAEPFAGAVIRLDVGVKGLPEPYFRKKELA